jgi:hypothetical protein
MAKSPKRAVFVIVTLASLWGASVPRDAHAQSPVCAFPPGYPGDLASADSLAAWMAARATARNLPPELPVMASLVESGLQNLNFGDADSVGFFQMRVDVWNQGIYAGYPQDPELQVKWFLDRATAVLGDAMLHGGRERLTRPGQFGRWIDAALRPSRASRGRYQLRLEEARRLIASGRALAGSWPFDGSTPADDAPRATITAWLATRALAAGLPGELPVMAALVESGLRNLPSEGTDAAGYFGMRVSLWNAPPYTGFPEKPELQVKWFIDQAIAARARRIAAGDPFFAQDPAQWGEWIADVERPAEHLRGRYQLVLEEARTLMRLGCGTLAP